MTLPQIPSLNKLALFLDFDGTLVPFANRPDEVRVPDTTIALLSELSTQSEGALAIVSGRPIADIDAMLAPLIVPVAGVHGLARRTADGRIITVQADQAELDAIAAEWAQVVVSRPGLIVERKPGAIALHWRQNPQAEQRCLDAARAAAANRNSVVLILGNKVAELHAAGADKGTAITAYLAEPPFFGKAPLFVGDDVTDEDGFKVVNASDGYSIKVGQGSTAARYRAASTTAIIDWLQSLASR